MVNEQLSTTGSSVKRVRLKSKRKSGYYYRIKTQESKERAEGVILVNKYHYYKVSSRVKTKSQASSRYQYFLMSRKKGVSKLPTTSGVVSKTPVSSTPEAVEQNEDMEFFTLHVRMDYDSADGARKNHGFVMRDSWISKKFKKDEDLNVVHQALLKDFKSAFSQEINGSRKHGFINCITDETNASLVNGIERGGYTEKVLLNYSYSGDSGSFRQVDRSLAKVIEERKASEEFLARSRK